MTLHEEFQKRLEKDKKTVEYQIERLLLEINENILKILEEKSMTKKDFAKRMGVSPAYITKLLNGQPNLTLKSLLKIALTLDVKLSVEIKDYAKIYEIEIPSDTRYRKATLSSKKVRKVLEREGTYSEGFAA